MATVYSLVPTIFEISKWLGVIAALGALGYLLLAGGSNNSASVSGGGIPGILVFGFVLVFPLFYGDNSARFPATYLITLVINLLLAFAALLFFDRKDGARGRLLRYFPLYLLAALVSTAWATKAVDLMVGAVSRGGFFRVVIFGGLGLLFLLVYLLAPFFGFLTLVLAREEPN